MFIRVIAEKCWRCYDVVGVQHREESNGDVKDRYQQGLREEVWLRWNSGKWGGKEAPEQRQGCVRWHDDPREPQGPVKWGNGWAPWGQAGVRLWRVFYAIKGFGIFPAVMRWRWSIKQQSNVGDIGVLDGPLHDFRWRMECYQDVAWMGCSDLRVRKGAEARVFVWLGDNGINLLRDVRKSRFGGKDSKVHFKDWMWGAYGMSRGRDLKVSCVCPALMCTHSFGIYYVCLCALRLRLNEVLPKPLSHLFRQLLCYF